ncbi:MAG: hypothetical protein HQ488_00595 [Parcubacteria group bacterium]|nr:hypothetical protein [Parcubacteria group bacterium]
MSTQDALLPQKTMNPEWQPRLPQLERGPTLVQLPIAQHQILELVHPVVTSCREKRLLTVLGHHPE